MKIRTLRGRLDTNDLRRLIVDDGRLNHGYKVKSFHVWPDATGVSEGVCATLSTQYDAISEMNAGDNRQIAWAFGGFSSGTNAGAGPLAITDPDHVVNQDLWIRRNLAVETNYLIVLEPLIMSESQTIMQLIKERSQDDIR